MQESSLLTPAEMEFIQQLNHTSPVSAQADPGLQFDAAEQTTAMLARCAAKEQLTIEAHVANQRLSFTPQLVTDEQDMPHLELGIPEIFDDGSFNRSWRLQLLTPLAMQTSNGERSSLCIHELSMSGLLVEQTAGSQPPEHFCLDLQLDEQWPISLQGELVRTTEGGLLAYELESLDDDSSTRLLRYLYQQHRHLYPQAHRA